MVLKDGRYYSRPFRTERRVTQGGPVSPTVSNIVVNAAIRAVMLEVFVPQESQHVLGWAAGEHNIVLYVYNGRIPGCNPIWLQMTLKVVVRMFNRVGLNINPGNTKAMDCTPGFIWGHQL